MPIEEFILGPIISTYENMIKDVDSQGITNEHVDNMKECFIRMQDLGQEHSDITAYMGVCMQENLFGKFGDLYSKALISQASKESGDPSNYDDAALLKQSITALKQAIDRIKQGKNDALKEATNHQEIDKGVGEQPNSFNNAAEVEALDNSDDLIKPIENLIALGEQGGITFPDFLRLQIEQGLDKAIEGTGATRKGLVYSLKWAEAIKLSPYDIAKCKKQLTAFDELSRDQKFGVPNWKELKWVTNDVNYEFEPDIIKWRDITNRWNMILDDLHMWSLAYCSHAGQVDPWKIIPEPQKSKAIRKSKDTLPGVIKQRERLLEKYYGITFQDIFTHETFAWAIETNHMYYSKAFIDFIKNKVYPSCIPLQHMPSELIVEREQMSRDNKEINPKLTEPAERIKAHYDSKFGEGRYVSKFGAIKPVESNAAPWD